MCSGDAMDALKIRFNQQMIEYYLHSKAYLDVARCYWEIYETVAGDEKLEVGSIDEYGFLCLT